MDPLITSALIAGGTGLLGSIFQSSENARQFARQKELLELQQAYNTTMWNKTNEYNSPANQLALYSQANVNPNTAIDAISGVAHASQVATPAVPSISSTGSSASALFNSIGTIADYLFKQKQTENLDAQNANLQAQTDRQKIENRILEKDAGIRDELNQLTLEQYRSNIQKTLADTDLSRKKTEEIAYNLSEILPEIKKKTVAEREKIAQDMKLSVQQLANEILQGAFLNERIQTERLTRSQIYFQIEGQKFRNRVDALHAKYADDFSIDINGDRWQMLVEAYLAGGENADKIIDALTETSTGIVKSTAENVVGPVTRPVRNLVGRYYDIVNGTWVNPVNMFNSVFNPK